MPLPPKKKPQKTEMVPYAYEHNAAKLAGLMKKTFLFPNVYNNLDYRLVEFLKKSAL